MRRQQEVRLLLSDSGKSGPLRGWTGGQAQQISSSSGEPGKKSRLGMASIEQLIVHSVRARMTSRPWDMSRTIRLKAKSCSCAAHITPRIDGRTSCPIKVSVPGPSTSRHKLLACPTYLHAPSTTIQSSQHWCTLITNTCPIPSTLAMGSILAL